MATSQTNKKTTAKSANGGSESSDKLAELASKAKLPLIVGGAAVAAGAVGGIARSHAKSKSGPVEALKRVPRNIDLDKVKSAGERLSSIGQQTVDVASAVEKTRKKHG